MNKIERILCDYFLYKLFGFMLALKVINENIRIE